MSGGCLDLRLLTLTEEGLTNDLISQSMMFTAFSRSSGLWDSVKGSRTCEKKSRCSALSSGSCSRSGSSAKCQAGIRVFAKASREEQQSLSLVSRP